MQKSNYLLNFKKIIFTLLIVTTTNSFGQNLSKELWNRVNKCHSMLEKPDFDTIIDDSKNGYLSISGSWPTCGCSCSSTVGAYKDSKGNYTYIQKETFSCSWENTISSNKNIMKVLPKKFGIKMFSNKRIDYNSKYASFFMDIEIPRIGTDTKISLKIVPLGLFVESKNPIIFSYAESDQNNERLNSQTESMYEIKELATKINEETTLELLINKKFDKIANNDQNIINKIIGQDYGKFQTIEKLSEKLKMLKNIYNLYSNLEYTSMILKWDRKKARFKIKSKNNTLKNMSFREFLIKTEYWGAVC